MLAGKPASARDLCYLTGDTTVSNPVYDFAVCDADPRLVKTESPRQVAGGAITENVLKCQLKPLDFAAYPAGTFGAKQQVRLQAVFSGGVCDWSRAAVGQQASMAPLTFVAGPGGVPMPAAPMSQAIP